MGIKLTPFSTQSYHVAGTGLLSKGYRFKRGEWTEIDSEQDLAYLLGQTHCILREERQLGSKWVTCVAAREAEVRVDDGAVETIERYQPGQQYRVSPHMFRLLNRRSDFEETSLVKALTTVPNARILITRAGGLGDVLMSTPAVRTLAKQFPAARIWYSTSDANRRIFKGCPFVERVVNALEAYDYAPFDITLDLNWWVETSPLQYDRHRPGLFADRLGLAACDSFDMYCVAEDADISFALSILPEGRPLVAVQTQGATWTRTPAHSRMCEIVSAMMAGGMTPVCIDNRADPRWDIAGVVNLTGQMDLGKLFGVIQAVDAVLSGDSGIVHAANALGKPTVALFGPVDPKLRIVDQPNCTVIVGNKFHPCPPCNDQQKRQCSSPPKCLDSIPVGLIVEKLQNLVSM